MHGAALKTFDAKSSTRQGYASSGSAAQLLLLLLLLLLG
jgi:hypothetical protein